MSKKIIATFIVFFIIIQVISTTVYANWFTDMFEPFNESMDNYMEEIKESENWMKKIPNNVKITELNIPGCHDAGTWETSLVSPIAELYGNCQSHPLVSYYWKNEHLDGTADDALEIGLLNMGYRYLDIRYGITGDAGDDKDSYGLQVVHGGYACKWKTSEDASGISHYENLTNDKLMGWIKSFLDEHPSETIIIDCTTDDNDSERNEKAKVRMYNFFQDLANHPDYSKYPKIYIGNHIPTLGEARGKIIVLTDEFDEEQLKLNGNKAYNWAFKVKGGVGDDTNWTTGEVYSSPDLKYKVYKNNQWDGVTDEEKWTWVRNGLYKSQSILDESKANDIDPFVMIYSSANNIGNIKDDGGMALVGTIGYYSDYINPKLLDCMMGELSNKFVGIIATDRGDHALSNFIWESNLKRFPQVTGSVFASGNVWIVAGIVAVVAVVGTGVVIYTRKRRKAETTNK